MSSIISFLQGNWQYIVLVLFALDQALAQIPAVESNSTFQLISNLIKSLAGKSQPPPPPAG